MENQSTPTVFESVAVAVVIVMYFCLGMYGYLLLAHCGFLIYSAWALFQKRRRIIAARRTIELFVCSAVSFFIAKVLATGHFNRKYGIFKENLDYSSTAWAMFIACTILLCAPLLCHSVRFTWRAFQAEHNPGEIGFILNARYFFQTVFEIFRHKSIFALLKDNARGFIMHGFSSISTCCRLSPDNSPNRSLLMPCTSRLEFG